MLARLQQFITVGGLLAAGLWAWACWRADHPGWALAGAGFLLGAHALVLSVEFVLLRLAYGDDTTPPATPAQLLRAWWGEVLAAPRVFCWRQPFQSRRWPDHLPAQAQGRRGLLLVHGFACNRGVWNAWLRRLHAQGVPFVAVDLEPVFGSIDDYIATLEQAVQRLERCTGGAPVIVAHSMGGLVVRRWWMERGDDARVHHAVTIGTPHHGTALAYFGLALNARQMRPLSGWLQTLKVLEPTGRTERMTCFYGHCDNVVFPLASAILPGAQNLHLSAVAHVAMIDHPGPWQEVQRRLAEPVRP